jgi:cytochrome c553
MKHIVTAMSLIGLLGTTAFADGAALYETCKKCHGAQGEKAALGGKSRVINTLSKAEIVTALQGYKAGSYGGKTKAIMSAPVADLTDAQMQEIADYISK